MDKPMTTTELFNKICDILKEKEEFPDILDYALAEESAPMPITNYEYSLRNNLDYGGSEGIYLDLWIMMHNNNGGQKKKLGTFKTLKDDQSAMRIMAQLLADFIVEESAYVNAHLDDFTWEGAQVCAFDENGKKLDWHYTCRNMETALKRKDELLLKYPRVVIRDNATREEKSYCI